jgi:hypothetical protein
MAAALVGAAVAAEVLGMSWRRGPQMPGPPFRPGLARWSDAGGAFVIEAMIGALVGEFCARYADSLRARSLPRPGTSTDPHTP